MPSECEKTFPIYDQARVVSCAAVEGANPEGSVWSLVVEPSGKGRGASKAVPLPLAGQFYMLQAVRTNTLLGRPISVFHVNKDGADPRLEFLILLKGHTHQQVLKQKE